MRVSILFILVISFLAVSCVNNTTTDFTPQNGKLVQNQDLVSQINSASSTVSIKSIEYSVESYAWRDFMPSVDPPVRLNCNNTLIREDGKTIQDDNIEIIQNYIARENEIWIPDKLDVRVNQSNPNQLHIVSHDGPTWEIGSKVNVALKIKDRNTEEIFFLSVPEVTIVRTD